MATFTKVSDQLKELTEGWTKWDIALYVGAPVALGVAGLWYLSRGRSKQGRKASGSHGGAAHTDRVNASAGKPGTKPPGQSQPQSRQELAQAAKNKGNKFFKEGRYDDAITCYTEAIKTCPPDIKSDMSTFYQNRAAAYENQKKYKNVVEDCTSALQLNPRYSKALARRSKAFEVLEKYRDALEDITKACLIEGFQNQAYLQAADRVLKTLGKTRASAEYKTKKPTQPSTFYVENYLAGFVNDPVALKFGPRPSEEDAENIGVKLKQEADDISDNGAVLLNKPSAFERAKNCLVLQEYDQIIALCDEELADEAKSKHVAEMLLLRGTMRLLQGMGEGALNDLSLVGNMENIDKTLQATALVREGCLRVQKDSSEDSLSPFEKAEKIDENNSDVYHHHGQQLLQLEKLDEAIAKFNRSIALSPNFPTSYVQKYYAVHRKAIVSEDLRLLSDAKTGFEETIARFPKCSDALILYAQALSDQGKFQEAEKYFKKAHDIQPRNANNIVHRGLMMLQWQGNVDKTLELLEDALKVDPTCQYAYEIRGTIEVQRGNLADAVKSFKKAISLSNSESEMAHLYSLMEAAEVQVKVAKDLNIQLPTQRM